MAERVAPAYFRWYARPSAAAVVRWSPIQIGRVLQSLYGSELVSCPAVSRPLPPVSCPPRSGMAYRVLLIRRPD